MAKCEKWDSLITKNPTAKLSDIDRWLHHIVECEDCRNKVERISKEFFGKLEQK